MTRFVMALLLAMACAPAARAQATPETLADRVMALPMTEAFLRRGLRAEAVDHLSSDMGSLMPEGGAEDAAVGDLLTGLVDGLMPEARQALRDDLVTAFEFETAFDPALARFESFMKLVETEDGSFAFAFLMASFLDARTRDDAPVARAMEALRPALQTLKDGN